MQRGTLLSYLASTEIIDPDQPKFADRRKRAAEIWLKGYKEMLALKLPAVAPELPSVGKGIGDRTGDRLEREAAQRRNAAEMRAWHEAQRVGKLVQHRDIFIRQLAENYQREPLANDEIETLATKILADPKAVDELMAKVLKK